MSYDKNHPLKVVTLCSGYDSQWLAGNSIVTNCMTAMFEELFFPSGKSYANKNGQLSLF